MCFKGGERLAVREPMVARVLGAFEPRPHRTRLVTWLNTAGGSHASCVSATAKAPGLRVTPAVTPRQLIAALCSRWASAPGRAAGVLVADGDVAPGDPYLVVGACGDDPAQVGQLIGDGLDELRRLVRTQALRIEPARAPLTLTP